MARVHVQHTIGNLERDCTEIAATTKGRMSRVVSRNVLQGNELARKFAIESSGPHGKHYYKRITSEMTGALSGEYGPTGVVDNNAVGASWRHGAPNTDLERSLDIIGPRFARDVGAIADDLFWP